MAGKKKEGLGGLKVTTGGLRRDDRYAATKTVFEAISIDAKNALTVIYMLQSPEDEVVLRAIASLESYGQRGEENLRLLQSLGIFKYILPLIHSNDYVIKRFSQKLIGMLCSLEEFREEMFNVDKILEIFLGVLEKESDVVMHEFSALTLAELSHECEAASDMLKIDNCINTLFLRITSPDPDVEKNCLDVMNHLLNDVNGVEAFVDSTGFEIKEILTLTSSRYPAIQVLAIEVLRQLLSWHRDARVLFAFRDAAGIETALGIMENEEWMDLHPSALDLLISAVDGPELCDYLLQTGCLVRMIDLLDTVESDSQIEKILAVLARMSQTEKGRLALHKVDMEKKFCSYLNNAVKVDCILESSCLGIANLAQCKFSLNSIMDENPIPELLGVLTSEEKTLNLRNLAAYALNVLVGEDKRAAERLLQEAKFENLCEILEANEKFPAEFCRNIIQTFTGLSAYHQLRAEVMSETTMNSLMSCIQSEGEPLTKDSSVQADALECLSEYLVDDMGLLIFNCLEGANKLIACLKSRYASIRERAAQVVIIACQSVDFVKSFIKLNGLNWLIAQKNTRYSMPSWNSAIEAIFSAFLPAKFAFTGRLDFHDITKEGFYVSSRPRMKFLLIEDYFENLFCPICPIYVANFEVAAIESDSIEELSLKTRYSEETEKQSSEKVLETQDLSKYMKGAGRSSGEAFHLTDSLITYPSVDYEENPSMDPNYCLQFSRYLPDPYLGEYLENLKKKIALEESELEDANWFCIHPKLVSERARIIAEFVAQEMSGAEPHQLSATFYKERVINEMKYQLGTTIFPLGYIRMGAHLERAVLFKVLSDRVGFPCALVRGSQGRAWVEIALPILNIQEIGDCTSAFQALATKSQSKVSNREASKSIVFSERTSVTTIDDEIFWFPKLQMEFFRAFPTHFLRPNAIVDLVEEPGRILKINSREADEYCGRLVFD